MSVACSSNKNALSNKGTPFTLTGTVRSVSSGSFTVQSDAPVTGCDNPAKVLTTASTAGAAHIGERVDITGTQKANCVLVADSISKSSETGPTGGTATGGGAKAATVPGPSTSPKVTKGPAPEGVIMHETPSVPPASQK